MLSFLTELLRISADDRTKDCVVLGFSLHRMITKRSILILTDEELNVAELFKLP